VFEVKDIHFKVLFSFVSIVADDSYWDLLLSSNSKGTDFSYVSFCKIPLNLVKTILCFIIYIK